MSGGFPWHRAFHPLCGADLRTLAGLVRAHGPPGPRGAPAFAVALASALARLPFTALERALDLRPEPPRPAPVFILGLPRSGTTHLHNLLAASGAFATAPPVLAALPWESRTLAPWLRPLVDPFLPRTRLIDGVALHPDAPTEDEVGLANLAGGSYFHAIYLPRRLAVDYAAALTRPTDAARLTAIRRYVAALGRRDPRPLLLKNPAYTAHVATLRAAFPGCRIVHIARDPAETFASARTALGRALEELALTDWRAGDVDDAILAAFPRMLAALRTQTRDLPPGVFAEVAFADLVADPERTAATVWRDLDLRGWRSAAAPMRAYLAGVRDYRPRRAALDPAGAAAFAAGWRDAAPPRPAGT